MKIKVREWKLNKNPLTASESADIHKEAKVHKSIARRWQNRGEEEGAQYYFGIAEGMDDTANQYREHFKAGKGGRKNPYSMRKLPGKSKYRVYSHSGGKLKVHAKGTTKAKAAAQLRILKAAKNPGIMVPVPGAKLIYNRVISIVASKADMKHQCNAECRKASHVYRHVFIKPARIWGLPSGVLLIDQR